MTARPMLRWAVVAWMAAVYLAYGLAHLPRRW